MGYAQVAAVKAEYEAQGATVILVDAGDYSQGTTYVSANKGAAAVTMMNAAGYDYATLGNHEFDFGYAQLVENMKSAEFKPIVADVLLKETGKSIFDGHAIEEVDGVKIGFFGMETPETFTKVNPGLIQEITFPQGTEMYACAQTEVDALKEAGADLIIGLVHLGVDAESEPNRSIDLYNNVTGIDFLIDGHSHTVMTEGPDGAPIQSTGTKASKTSLMNVGLIQIDNASKKIEKNELIPITEESAKDAAVAAKAQEIMDAVDAEYGKVFAKSEVELNGDKAPNGNRDSETNLGDLITDAMKWGVLKEGGLEVPDENVVAITNGGGIRAWIHKGDVTKNDVNTVLPFGNTVAVVYVKGSELLEALEASTYSTPGPVGGFPQVSGIKFNIDVNKEYDKGEQYPESTYYGPASIQRVSIDNINGKPFDKDATYAVVTNNFCAAGGDTYYAFKAASSQFDTGLPMDEVLMDYITTELDGVIGETYAEPQGRITQGSTAKEYKLTTTLTDGDQIVIYSPSAAKAMSNEAVNTYYRAGKDVTIESGKIVDPAADLVWTVAAAEGGFTLSDAEGHKLSNGTRNSLPLDDVNDVWELQHTDGKSYLVNTTAVGSSGDHKAVEWYNNDFTSYYLDTTKDAYVLEIYALAEAEEEEDDKIIIGGLEPNVWTTKYGNIYTNCTAAKLEELGFAYGDIVNVQFLDQSLDLPLVPTFSYVDSGTPGLFINKNAETGKPEGYAFLAINMGDFTTTYGIATKTVNEDKTWFWTANEGVTFPIEVKLTMAEKGGYAAEMTLRDINRTDNRADYPDLTDAEFANFRQITTTGMGDVLYRGSSPINPEIGRNTYADAELAKAKVTVIMNLANDQATAAGYEGFADTYYSKQNVVYLNLGVEFFADEFKSGLATGLRHFAANPGIYYVHCTEGKDRAGFVSALLECFMGATYDEVVADYLKTYTNYYTVVDGKQQPLSEETLASIADANIVKTLKRAFGVEDLKTANLANEATEYITELGLTADEIAALKTNLGGGTTPPPTPSTASYVKVTSAEELTAGQYLIVYETDSIAMDGSRTDSLDSGHNVKAVTITDGEISAESVDYYFTYDGNGTFTSASGLNLGHSQAKNGMDGKGTNTVSLDAAGNAVIMGSGGFYLRFNKNAGDTSYRFRYYAEDKQQAIVLYKLVEG